MQLHSTSKELRVHSMIVVFCAAHACAFRQVCGTSITFQSSQGQFQQMMPSILLQAWLLVAMLISSNFLAGCLAR